MVLLIPALTIWVSVTISQPARRAAMAFCTAWRGKGEIVGVVKVRGGVDDALDDGRVFRVELPVAQKLGDDGEAALLDIHRLHRFAIMAVFLLSAGSNKAHRGAQVCVKMKVRKARVERFARIRAAPASSARLFRARKASPGSPRPSGEIRARRSTRPHGKEDCPAARSASDSRSA